VVQGTDRELCRTSQDTLFATVSRFSGGSDICLERGELLARNESWVLVLVRLKRRCVAASQETHLRVMFGMDNKKRLFVQLVYVRSLL